MIRNEREYSRAVTDLCTMQQALLITAPVIGQFSTWIVVPKEDGLEGKIAALNSDIETYRIVRKTVRKLVKKMDEC